MQLDMFTALVECGAAMLLLGILFVILWSQDRQSKWLLWWSAPYFFAAIAALLFVKWQDPPTIASTSISNSALFLTFGFVWQATRVFGRRPVVLWPLGVAIILWVGPCFWPPYLVNLPLRVVVSSIIAAGFLSMAAFELWRERAEQLPSRNAAVIVLGLGSAVFAVRVPLVGLAPFPLGGLPIDGTVLAVFTLILFAIGVSLTVLMVSMTKERGEQEQRQFALSDPLTGLLNRRAFLTQAQRLLRRQKSMSQPLSLLILDLDHFKQVNDRYGHETGDRVLVKFAAVLEANVRPMDKVYRMGGEEFCCLLPGAMLADGYAVAQRICDEFQASSVEAMGTQIRATVSIGVASTEVVGYEVDALQASADAAVYEAKARGRNLAVMAAHKTNEVALLQQSIARRLKA
ncbi:MAG TPA: GGDEF domain-containing protein [Devosiaceae bacterium]